MKSVFNVEEEQQLRASANFFLASPQLVVCTFTARFSLSALINLVPSSSSSSRQPLSSNKLK